MSPKDSPPLFVYSLTPETIPTGGPGHEPVTLTIGVANETGKEQACKQIAFTLPAQLRGGAISLSTTSDTWALTADSTEPGVYHAEPQGVTTGLGAKERIGFVFGGVEPASTPGPATIEISEETGEVRKGQLDATLVQGGPAITKFTADFLYVAPGAKVTFSWSTEGADKVVLDWGEGSHDGGSSEDFTVEPEATIVATLTAYASGGAKRTAQLTVTVERPEVLSFSLQPQYVVPGTPVSLSWKTLFAERCSLQFHPTGVEKGEAPGDVPPNADGYQQTVQRSGNFLLQAIGEGYTDPRQQSVTVFTPPVINSVEVHVDIGGCEGGHVRASWHATGASSASLSVNGNVSPANPSTEEITMSEEISYTFQLAFLSSNFGLTVVTFSASPPNQGSRRLTMTSPTGINNLGSDVHMEWSPEMSGHADMEGKSIPLGGSGANVTLPATPPTQGPLFDGTLAGPGSVNWQVEANAYHPSLTATGRPAPPD